MLKKRFGNGNCKENEMNVSLGAHQPFSGPKMPTSSAQIMSPSGSLPKKEIAKNEKAARDFEAVLLTPVLDALQKTFSSFGASPDSKAVGASDYRQMGTEALAQSIAARGGIGIAQMILSHLQSPKVPGKE
jgi:Rod binding domain-containing protein